MNLTLNQQRLSQVKPSATLAMAAKAKAMIQQGIDVDNLSAGEPDCATPACIVRFAQQALNDKATHGYTASRGTDELVAAMRQKLAREQHVSYEANEVIATVGTKGALSLAFDALLGPQDEVIIFAPYWVTYPDLVRLAGATPVVVSTSIDDGYAPRMDDVKRAITTKTKAIVLSTPNNPTGACLSREVLTQLMDLVAGTDIWVISDEIYERLTYDGFEHVSPASLSPDARARTLVVGGVAKAYAMTGWRLGIAAGPKALIDAMLLLQQQRVSCPTAIAQAAAAYALREDAEVTRAVAEMRETYARRRAVILPQLQALPFARVHAPEGAFYFLVQLAPEFYARAPVANDVELATALLEEAHVATVPGSPFGAPGAIRLSFAAADHVLARGVKRIATYLQRYV